MTNNGVEFTDKQNDVDDDAIFKGKKRTYQKHALLKGLLGMSKKGLLSLVPHFKRRESFGYYKGDLIPKDFKGLKK